MRVKVPQKSLKARQLDAEVRSSQWLADGNEARENGDKAKAEKCYAKSLYWLDRYNLLAGKSDKPAPRR
ncbi:hypothetical protein RCH14_004559 [Massilia sp. MP_M2]|uniref:hypothetical protein n=1 Tax=Massilia sp. MP_M2 TaxID=3071713 RepID=UPI00319E3459